MQRNIFGIKSKQVQVKACVPPGNKLFTWANGDPDLSPNMSSSGHNELMPAYPMTSFLTCPQRAGVSPFRVWQQVKSIISEHHIGTTSSITDLNYCVLKWFMCIRG